MLKGIPFVVPLHHTGVRLSTLWRVGGRAATELLIKLLPQFLLPHSLVAPQLLHSGEQLKDIHCGMEESQTITSGLTYE